MKRLSCKDTGLIDCNWEGTASNEDELIRMAREHSRKVHNFQATPDQETKLRRQIREV